MTTDERISKDLALVGRASRERPIPLDATLRKIGVLPATASARTPSTVAMANDAQLALVRIYVVRVGRAAAGSAAIACTLALTLYSCFAQLYDWREPNLFVELGWFSKFWIAVIALGVVSGIYVIAVQRALRRAVGLFAGADLATAKQTIAGLGGLATRMFIVGTMSLLLFFGMMQVTIGGGGLGDLFSAGPVAPSLQLTVARWTIVFLVVAMAGTYIGAHAIAVRSSPPSRAWLISGVLLVAATVLVGVRYDVGPVHVDLAEGMPSLPFRGCLTVTGTLGLFLIVSTIALAIRRREEAVLTH